MNTRICSIVTAVTLVATTAGCSGMRNFLFGRGARCGSCNPLASILPQPGLGAPAPAPCGPPPAAQPYYAPAPNCQSPPGAYVAPGVDCGHPGDCGCGGVASGYGADPYLAPGQMSGDQWTPGSQTYSDPSVYPGNQYPGAPLPSGDWQARRYDSDGNQILWEEPLPPGARGT